MTCHIFWGSHGCNLPEGHDGQHWCVSCCRPDDEAHMLRHETARPSQYGTDGCAGSWPYYGEQNMAGKTTHGLGFFRYEAPDWKFIYLPDEFARMAGLDRRPEFQNTR